LQRLLLRENAVEVLETLDFNRIPARIEEEHGPLLAGLSFEADDRRYIEDNARFSRRSANANQSFN
jgi:hypothetical protein